MTNSEAIRILESMKDELILAFDHDRKEALSLAISALQAQYSKTIRICDTCKHDPPEMDKWPCMDCDMRNPADRWEAKDVPDINVGDMISRQAAIDAFEDTTFTKNEVRRRLSELPSAQPERCEDCENFRKARLLIPQSEPVTNCHDLTAAIEAIEFGITYAKAINKETGEVSELFQASNDELRKAADRIKQLPSAQPDNHEVVVCWQNCLVMHVLAISMI